MTLQYLTTWHVFWTRNSVSIFFGMMFSNCAIFWKSYILSYRVRILLYRSCILLYCALFLSYHYLEKIMLQVLYVDKLKQIMEILRCIILWLLNVHPQISIGLQLLIVFKLNKISLLHVFAIKLIHFKIAQRIKSKVLV